MLWRRLQEYGRFLKSLWKTNIRLLWGMWRLTKLPQPVITVFGGARIPLESDIAKKAAQLTHLLADDGFSIITGGGPGIMEAANFGAFEALKECEKDGIACVKHIVSAGVGLLHLNKDRVNPYVQTYVAMDHFFARKWLLVRYSVGFVVFPGGFGTLDELFEIITLVQCNRMEKLPIILVDKLYWAPFIDWLEMRALKAGLISEAEKSIIQVIDNIEEVAQVIKRSCKSCEKSVLHDGFGGMK